VGLGVLAVTAAAACATVALYNRQVWRAAAGSVLRRIKPVS